MSKRAVVFFIIINSLASFGSFFIWASFVYAKSCTECHSDIGKGHTYTHPALNLGCESCHLISDGKKHPEEKNSIKLKSDIPELCIQCHKESKFQGKYVHLPIEKGMCLMCHEPHQTNFKKLLLWEKPQEVCYRCHAKEKFENKYVHKVAQGGCGIRCHSHHTSEYPKLLSSKINDMCAGCHNYQQSGLHIVSLPKGKVHPVFMKKDPKNPKNEMTCISCHNPHSSKYQKLFTYKNICKRCHIFY